MISHSHSTETPFSGADAVIMADPFRKALRKPDFAGRTIEWGDSTEAPEQKEHRLFNRELAEEGRDIRSVGRQENGAREGVKMRPMRIRRARPREFDEAQSE
jgi:hypothetical protein